MLRILEEDGEPIDDVNDLGSGAVVVGKLESVRQNLRNHAPSVTGKVSAEGCSAE